MKEKVRALFSLERLAQVDPDFVEYELDFTAQPDLG